uniref:Putative secreted protein n=1 Tax=Rhipicephalus microplus TaxID=6941 RepID=A0A6G5A3A5_RHIMP
MCVLSEHCLLPSGGVVCSVKHSSLSFSLILLCFLTEGLGNRMVASYLFRTLGQKRIYSNLASISLKWADHASSVGLALQQLVVLEEMSFLVLRWRDTRFSPILCLFGGCRKGNFSTPTFYCNERRFTDIHKKQVSLLSLPMLTN